MFFCIIIIIVTIVVVVISRGDRALNMSAKEMSDYCLKENRLSDFCGDSLVAFAAIELHHIVDKVPSLVCCCWQYCCCYFENLKDTKILIFANMNVKYLLFIIVIILTIVIIFNVITIIIHYHKNCYF